MIISLNIKCIDCKKDIFSLVTINEESIIKQESCYIDRVNRIVLCEDCHLKRKENETRR